MVYQFVPAPLEDPDQDRLVTAYETPEEKARRDRPLGDWAPGVGFRRPPGRTDPVAVTSHQGTGKGCPTASGRRSGSSSCPIACPILAHHFALRNELGISTRQSSPDRRPGHSARPPAHLRRERGPPGDLPLDAPQKILDHDRLFDDRDSPEPVAGAGHRGVSAEVVSVLGKRSQSPRCEDAHDPLAVRRSWAF